MEANNFVAKLKACDVNSDICDLKEALDAFKVVLVKLPEKDKPSFSLNVLCTLCRNLEKVPTWRAAINNTDLVTFSIECVRHTRNMQQSDLVKILACIYHIHKYVVKQNTKMPPELILKLSFMPFEYDEDSLLREYYKTYWSILADRLTFIERLKSMKLPIMKLLPKFIDDILKVIKIYDTVQFCANLLTFLVKKLHYVYNDIKINEYFERIFDCIAKKDLRQFKTLPEKEIIDIYVKINDCLYIVSENGLRNNDSVIDNVSRLCVSILGHRPDTFHCLQLVYPNGFCCIFKDRTNVNLIDNVLNSLLTTCEMTEKLGYTQIMNATYPFISQLLRLYVDNVVNNKNLIKTFNGAIQEKCLKLILYLIPKLHNTKQLLKCENCTLKSGLHDALRLSFLVKNCITASMNNNMELNNLELYIKVIEQQYIILNELDRLGCCNYGRCLSKLQTDTHNVAIMLNKSKHYEHSIQLFDMYLQNEFKNLNGNAEMSNVSRALYNRSICELDNKLFEESLKNAYLSLIFSLPGSLDSEKYMSLVMDVKAKAAKEDNDVQLLSVLEVCKNVVGENLHGSLVDIIKNLEFSKLLKHEFTMYAKLWPSIAPIAGVWKSLYGLVRDEEGWVKKEDSNHLLWTLYEIMLKTPTVVRTIHDETYRHIVNSVLETIEMIPVRSSKERLVHATLLCLKTEYEMTEASNKYDWKKSESDLDAPCTRTIAQDQTFIRCARTALEELELAVDSADDIISPCLRIIEILVPELFHLSDNIHAMQLSSVCCDIAAATGDREVFIRNAGVLVYNSDERTDLQHLISRAAGCCREMINETQYMDVILNFMCVAAMYYNRIGNLSLSAHLIQTVQARLLTACEADDDLNLDLSLGRLMEAQALLCSDRDAECPSTFGALNAIHRHYLSITNNESRWCVRRLRSLDIKLRAATVGAQCVAIGRALRLTRRVRVSAAALGRTGAARRARALVDVIMTDEEDAPTKIDSLKYILDLQPAGSENVTQPMLPKQQLYTPRRVNLEVMRDCMLQRAQLSPSLPYTAVPVFQTPEFLTHACTCACHACDPPACTIIACQMCFSEASLLYRTNEMEIARNYFNGALDAFQAAEMKLKKSFERYEKIKGGIVDVERRKMEDDFRQMQLEFLIELSYFELSRDDFVTSDGYVVRIHEIMSDLKRVDPYVRSEVYNLMVASAELRKTLKKPEDTGLEVELEDLKLSPDREVEIQKTPETKMAVPKIATAKIVKDEEILKKRKVIKLNLDESSEEKVEEKVTRSKAKSQFKIPDPVTARPVLENMTPRPTRSRPLDRSRPEITVQQPSLDQSEMSIFTPKSSTTNEFFTPSQTTPGEQFFTPMSSVKTYSKRIIKNLEKEFSTPLGKENLQHKNLKVKVETGSVKTLKDRKVLKRATSPGKLDERRPEARPRRMRQPTLDK